jgi:Zn-dependent M28 family amino/carboxypeptidase
VAAVLESARVLKKHGFLPRCTIQFIAFGAEELGLLGSYAFTSVPDYKGKITMMLNNDMIACQHGTNQSAWIVNITDYSNSHALRSDAEKLCCKYSFLGFSNDNTYYRQSDSYPFFQNGYKALFFISDIIDPAYHTINDLSVNCNFCYCREIIKINCAMIIDKN